MTKLIELGLASEETKGTFLARVQQDPAGVKIEIEGIKYRTKPSGPNDPNPTADDN